MLHKAVAVLSFVIYLVASSHYDRHYEVSFGRLFKAVNFAEQGANVQGRSTVCFKRLIFQPIPLILFTWDGWWQDMKCSFVGPSSLFQRWNLKLRSNYNLLVRITV